MSATGLSPRSLFIASIAGKVAGGLEANANTNDWDPIDVATRAVEVATCIVELLTPKENS